MCRNDDSEPRASRHPFTPERIAEIERMGEEHRRVVREVRGLPYVLLHELHFDLGSIWCRMVFRWHFFRAAYKRWRRGW